MQRLSLMVAVVVFASLSVLAAETKPAETKPVTGTAEAKVDRTLDKYTPCEHPHGFYLDAGVSALFFNPPERKSLPIYDTDGSTHNALKNLTSFESDSLAVYPRLAFGYEFAKEATPSVLGEDLRVEFSSAFFQTDADGTKGMVLPLRHVPSSFALGAFYGPGGAGSMAILNRNDIGIGAVIPCMPIHFKAEYDQLDLNLGMRTEYTLVRDRLAISPYLGFTRQTLGQELGLSAHRLQGIAVVGPANPRYKESEELETEAFGATIGLDFKVKIIKRLSFTAGGTVSPLWAHTDMRLSYFGDAFDFVHGDRIGLASALKGDEDKFTFRAGAKASFSYEVNKWLVVSANGGLDYWDYVPQVKYPTDLRTEAVMSGFSGYTAKSPTLTHDNMLNWMGGVNFTVRFGCP